MDVLCTAFYTQFYNEVTMTEKKPLNSYNQEATKGDYFI